MIEVTPVTFYSTEPDHAASSKQLRNWLWKGCIHDSGFCLFVFKQHIGEKNRKKVE